MKIIKTANGKKQVKMSKSEWVSIGKKAGWMKTAAALQTLDAKVQVFQGNQVGQPITLQLDVGDHSIILPNTGAMAEIYQTVQESMGAQQQGQQPYSDDVTNQSPMPLPDNVQVVE